MAISVGGTSGNSHIVAIEYGFGIKPVKIVLNTLAFALVTTVIFNQGFMLIEDTGVNVGHHNLRRHIR